MKLHILSDLHLEFAPFEPPETDADVVILAGDIHTGKRGVEWAIANFPDKPVVYVLGNHEYYSKAMPKLRFELREMTDDTNIHILENNTLKLPEFNVAILGATLWTDFNLFGTPARSMARAHMEINDYLTIWRSPDYARLRPTDTKEVHQKSVAWIEEEGLELINSGWDTVVVSHHAPSESSLPDKYLGNRLNPAYASNLDWLIKKIQPKMWVHGHIHSRIQYKIGETTVIANPRGYPSQTDRQFREDLVAEI